MIKYKNKKINFEYYEKKLQTKLIETANDLEKAQLRYEHSIGVSEMCVELVEYYNLPIDKEYIKLVGLLHDYAKYCNMDEFEEVVALYDLDEKILESSPKTLHAFLGGYILRKDLNTNKSLIKDISVHATGDKNMTTIQEVVYLADWIERKTRYKPYFVTLRKKAFINLKATIAVALKQTIERLEKNASKIEKQTLDAYNYYKDFKFESVSKIDRVLQVLDRNIISNIIVYDTKKVSPFYDYVLVSDTSSERQMNAVFSYLKQDFEVRGVEKAGDWTLVDLGDVIINVFKDDCREKYGLDRIYINMERYYE